MRLQNKICLITGGGSGIGRAASLLFAREGAKVVVADKALSSAKDVAAQAGKESLAVAVDVSDSASVRSMVEEVVRQCGRIDVLVNNAGYGIRGDVVETSEQDWANLMAVNVNGVFYGCKHTIPVMRKQGGGAIVNTASTVSSIGIRDRAAYCASKGAVASLTRAMALDHVGDNIRVNCVAPGTIDSPYFAEMFARMENPQQARHELEQRQAMNRLGKPEEIAYAMLYLACDESSFVTGTMLTVDGGWTAQ
jgi:meso-butanediol dehydrogenase / (S,S)-butanediol dehydrogenase / diacetyl reductase